MNLPPLVIGNLKAKVPIVQGGMGIGISLSGLAGAVAKEGGIGIISGVQIGFNEPDFKNNIKEANIRALKYHIDKAKKDSCGNGIVGVNLMVAMNNYDLMVKTAVEEKIDLIISGAGLPTKLPELVAGSNTKICPIVSSGKAASVISKLWDKRYNVAPDMVVVEGYKAGGHLGFKLEELNHGPRDLKEIVQEVKKVIAPYEQKYKKSIPVVAAGGIFDGKDISEQLLNGAEAVQMATRFVCTEECDAHENFKKAYIDANEEDIYIVKSPVGMPGRAIKNKFLNNVEHEKVHISGCFSCLKDCDRNNIPYCITEALIQSAKGNVDEGLIFVGANVYKNHEIVSVKELMKNLVQEAEEYYF